LLEERVLSGLSLEETEGVNIHAASSDGSDQQSDNHLQVQEISCN
jgi:hypothetical protein